MVGSPRKSSIAALVVAMTVSFGFQSSALAADWWKNVKIKGDLRYRHEMIDKEDKDARHRHRVRARIGVYGTLSPYVKVGIQLATGSDDPVSTNQTIGDAFSTKPIGLDMAFVELSHYAMPGLTVRGGKFKNPFFKPGGSELIWDADWNPEGGVVAYEHDFDDVSVNFIGSGLWIEERPSGENVWMTSSDADSWLAAAQGVCRYHLNDRKSSLAAGASFFSYENIRGFRPFHTYWDANGNSTVLKREEQYPDMETIRYASDFEILEVFCEAVHEIEDIPVAVMGDFVSNTAAHSLNTGWLIGLRAGKTRHPGTWEFRYIYRELEADAVVGIFTDSDFRGGGTDARGHEIGGAVQVADGTAFKATYFVNEIGLEEEETEGYQRLQVDLQLKF
jgi:hypothetical protein